MKNTRGVGNRIISKAIMPAGVQDLMKVYERFQESYAMTEHYLGLISPKTHQSSSNQSFVIGNK